MWTNDEIHGRIGLCPVFKAFMDSPQVQRLHGLKQLATAFLVYMNANHTRFDHSMGVAYLAEKLCSLLQKHQPNLNITDKCVLCVKLAGLLHDLGHGPFSHVYETVVSSDWSHENASLMMIDALLEYMGLAININKLDEPLEQIGDGIEAESIRVYKRSDNAHEIDPESILTSRDFVFIKEMIIGKPLAGFSDFIGRPQNKEFLYDIVSNRHSGLDVDKMDYFARDSNRTTGKVDMDIRLLDEAFVAWGECPKPKECHKCSDGCPRSHLMICYPPKLRRDAMEFFKKRFKLHNEVYQHKTAVAGKLMVIDILAKASAFRIPTLMESEQGVKSVEVKELPISRAMENPTSYLRLKDSVLDQIMATTSPELREARLLIERYQKRDLYTLAFKKQIKLSHRAEARLWKMSEKEIANEILRIEGKHADKSGGVVQLNIEDFIVDKMQMHHGGGQANPVDFMRFLAKEEDEEELLGPIGKLPHAVAMTSGLDGSKSVDMQELWLRFYCRGDDAKLDLLRHILKLWDFESQSEAMFTEEYSDSDGDDRRESVPLTQEEEESSFRGTPQKGGGYGFDSDGEPSPFPAPRRMH